MTDPDVIMQLDTWLHECELAGAGPSCVLIRRARDEIVRLRHQKAELWDAIQTKLHAARAEALEEAAQECELNYSDPHDCAAVIRDLKDK